MVLLAIYLHTLEVDIYGLDHSSTLFTCVVDIWVLPVFYLANASSCYISYDGFYQSSTLFKLVVDIWVLPVFYLAQTSNWYMGFTSTLFTHVSRGIIREDVVTVLALILRAHAIHAVFVVNTTLHKGCSQKLIYCVNVWTLSHISFALTRLL